MGPINTLGYLIQHTASILYRQSDQVLQERLGIGMSQFKLLMILQHRPHIQQRSLAECLGQTEASISRQIKLLCDKSMLAVEVNPENRREHRAVATAKGVKVTMAAQDVLAGYYEPVFEQFNDKQKTLLIEMLGKIHANACQPGKSFACERPFNI